MLHDLVPNVQCLPKLFAELQLISGILIADMDDGKVMLLGLLLPIRKEGRVILLGLLPLKLKNRARGLLRSKL
jgi:hypothetical protein